LKPVNWESETRPEHARLPPAPVKQRTDRIRKRYRDLFREAVADTLDSPTPEQIEQEIRELIRLGAR
jgi:hypothetical protein